MQRVILAMNSLSPGTHGDPQGPTAPLARAQCERSVGPGTTIGEIMVPPKYNLVLSLILFASVAISEAKPEALVLEDLVANTEKFLKSYGVKENTLTKAKIFFEENVGSTEEISQTAKTVKKSIEKAKDMFAVNLEKVRKDVISLR